MASQAAELKMPQAGGAAREPSMEEILASIRRIIEDSDQGRKPDDMLAPEASARAAEPEPVDLIAANAPSSRFDPPGPARPAVEAPAASRRQPEEAPTFRTHPHEFLRSEAAQITPRMEPEPDSAEPTASKRFPDVSEMAAPAAMDLAGEAEAVEGMEPAPARPVPARVEKASLISERTGRQVAAAFGELTEAFEASRRKSFDELAAEMMRPMLQDWLDNNLPTLVEKLVREEIERVARGGR